MSLYVVRHAKAGSRQNWDGPDECRPLNAKGQLQAAGLAEGLARRPISRIFSSPSLRCVQTVEPLAKRLGKEIEQVEALNEGQSLPMVLAFFEDAPDESVLCSHGDVIPDLLDGLVHRGMEVDGLPDWRKASTWIIERDGESWVRGRAEPPPHEG